MMPQIENPVTTLVRLLDKNMHVVKEDLSIAKITVTQAWYDRELLKNADGQVTVALEHCEDHKISFSGSARRRAAYMHVDVWTVDKPEHSVVGREMRETICAEINRIIREKRNKPNETSYNYVGTGQTSTTHKAYYVAASNEPPPTDLAWSQLTNNDYGKTWYSDDDRYTNSVDISAQFALMLFRFKIDSASEVVKKIVLRFEGYGTALGGSGVTIKVWNFSTSVWQQTATGSGEADETVTITLTSALAEFIDDDGYAYLLARTTYASDGVTPAVLHCDFSECIVTVEGITYCDVESYRDEDMVNVKPFVWHTRFTVKAWLFETVPAT